MTDNITLVRGDDSNFLNQVLLIVSYKTSLDLAGYKTRFTIENPNSFIKTFEVINNTVEINLDKVVSSTLEIGKHRCNIKLIDTLGRVKTVKNFDLYIEDEFKADYKQLNEYELEVVLDDGINKYKNYNELSNIPEINNVLLKGNIDLETLGIPQISTEISEATVETHNIDPKAHQDIRNELSRKQDHLIAGANITIIDGIISSVGPEGGANTDYKLLGNKPKVNNVVLDGNITLDELGVQPSGEYITEEVLNSKGFITSVPSGYITEEELESENFLKEVPDTYYTDEQNSEKYFTKEEAKNKQDKLTIGENITIENNVINAVIPNEYITEDELTAKGYITSETTNTLLNRKQNTLLAGDNIKLYRNLDGTYTISALSPKDQQAIASYNTLRNLPTINNVVVLGDKTLDDYGIQPKGNYQDKLTAGENISIAKDDEDNLVIKTIIPEWVATDLELTEGLATKADKADSLQGYNIQDTYTKTETDDKIGQTINSKLTNVILDNPNGTAEYTEKSITVKAGLRLLLSNGFDATYEYKNIDTTVDDDITLELPKLAYIDSLKNFYLVLSYTPANTVSLNLIPQELYIENYYLNIPTSQTGYVRNLADNKFYEMVEQKIGVYLPVQKYMQIIGRGTSVADTDGNIKITSFIPYNKYGFVTNSDLENRLDKLQSKLTFGQNFEIKNGKVEYRVPFNYVTKEFLIDNAYATQVSINDAVSNHNTNSSTHQDIRNMIKSINDKNYVTPAQLNNKLQGYAEITDIPDARNYCTKEQYESLLSKYNAQQQQINDILEIIESLH